MRLTLAFEDTIADRSHQAASTTTRTRPSHFPVARAERGAGRATEAFDGRIAGITVKVRRRVATIQASDARDLNPATLFAAVASALGALNARDGVDAVVLRGRRLFAIDRVKSYELGSEIRNAVRAVSDCTRPVVAMIEGCAAGPGLELALACAARVAREGASLSFPGVGFGRLPIHGGARRLPLLVGFPEAARMMVFGEVVSALEALRIGLLDALDIDDIEHYAASLPSSAAAFKRRHLSGAEQTAAEAFLLGVGQRLKRERPREAVPLAVLRALEGAIGVSEADAVAEAIRLDEKLTHLEEASALLHASLGGSALRGLAAAGEVRLADLTSRAFWPLLREAIHLLDEGATPAQVDRCLTTFGYAMGPFTRSDRLGVVNLFGSGPGAGAPDWRTYSPTLDLMVDAERLGGAGQAGWFQPGNGDSTLLRSDPAVDRLLDRAAVSQWLIRRPIPDEVITRRCLYAAMNGTAALADAPDLDARSLDAIWTTCLGFPRWKGGPLFQGALVGHDAVVAELESLRRKRDTAGPPSPALANLLAEVA